MATPAPASASAPDAAASAPCWCTRMHFSAELLQRVPAGARDKACICAACAQSAPRSDDRSAD